MPGNAVIPANEDGARLLGTHLYELGHRKIGVIGGPRQLHQHHRPPGRPPRRRPGGRGHLPAKRIAYADFTRDGRAAAAKALLTADPA